MICDLYQKHEMEKISDQEFQTHLKTCHYCQQQIKFDNDLLDMTQSLREPIQAPLLWDRIENKLQIEKSKQNFFNNRVNWSYSMIFKIAAMIIFIIGVGTIFIVHQNQKETGLLATSVIQKVEKQEIKYIEAIAALEKTTQPQLDKMDIELQFLYRDRLETIDRQIALCKEEIQSNPANAHIRKYLMMALKDKQETLTEILSMDPNIS